MIRSVVKQFRLKTMQSSCYRLKSVSLVYARDDSLSALVLVSSVAWSVSLRGTPSSFLESILPPASDATRRDACSTQAFSTLKHKRNHHDASRRCWYYFFSSPLPFCQAVSLSKVRLKTMEHSERTYICICISNVLFRYSLAT